MTSKKIFFSHVPKAAGCAIQNLLNPDKVLHWDVSREFCIGEYISENSLLDFLKIGFVRNPWDRLVSCFFFFKQGEEHEWPDADAREIKKMNTFESFNDFVLDLEANTGWWQNKFHFLDQHLWTHSSEGVLALDYLGKYETLNEDIEALFEKLNKPPRKLKKINASRHGHYTTYYDDKAIKIVSRIYSKDIALFGYKFGE